MSKFGAAAMTLLVVILTLAGSAVAAIGGIYLTLLAIQAMGVV